MSEIAVIGYGTIAVGFIVTVVTGIAAVVGAVSDSPRFRTAAEYGSYLIAAIFGVAAATMIHAFIHQDFSLIYVYQYSDADIPWIYQFAGFWGGQAGSLLFWTVTQAFFLAAVVFFHRRRDNGLMPWVITINVGVLLFFVMLLLFVSNPFETFSIIDAPANGRGLNPQLQTMLMVIHPPALLIGYVSATVPFSFAMAALISGRLGDEWLKATRKWTLVSWVFLTVGLVLGMLWAYTELGWGGYWAWDPVENAALIPWFVMTAFLHSAIIQEKRGMLKRWNMFLILTTWLLTIFGTFLTRSGLIASVHSFAASSIGDYFLFFMATSGVAIYAVLIWRWNALKTDRAIESFLSREFTFLLNNWVLLACAGVVWLLTMFPKLLEMFTGEVTAIGPPVFNRFMTPIGLFLLLLMAVGTVISWRKATARNFQRNFVKPLIFAGLVTGTLPLLYFKLRVEPLGVETNRLDVMYAIVAVFVSAFAIATTTVEFWRGTRARMQKLKVGPLTALTGLVMRNQRRYGGYVIHIGVVLLMFGFVGNAFIMQQEVVMHVGQSVEFGDYDVVLTNVREEQDPEKVKMFADVDLMRDGELVSQISPGRYFFHASQSGTSEVDIRSTPFEDVFFAVTNYDIRSGMAGLLMVINPFVWWIWVGSLFMIFGTLLALWPELEPVAEKSRARRSAATTAAGLIALLAIPATLFMMEAPAFADQKIKNDTEVESIEQYDAETWEIFELIRCECTGCNGLSIARCHPGCGPGMRDKARIVSLHDAGMSKQEVIDLFEEERGPGGILRPKQEGFNHLTWLLPLLGATVGISAIVLMTRRRKGTATGDDDKKDDDPDDDEEEEEENLALEHSDEDAERLDDLERALEAME